MAQSQSQLLNKLKTRSKGAWAKARHVEAKARGGGGFPPSMKGLVCRLRSYKLAETTKGDPYFSLTGIVVEPPEFEGRRATFSWFINESEYASVEDNLNQLSNDMQLIYGDELPEDMKGILEVMKELCERGVAIVFNTGRERKGGKAPNLFIQGLADGYDDDPEGSAAQSGEEGSGGEEEGSSGEGAESPDENVEGEGSEAGGDEVPTDSAGAGDGDGDGGDGSVEAEEGDAWEPAKDDVYLFPVTTETTVKDPKTKKMKKVKKVTKVEVKVLAVNTKKQTFNLQTTAKGPKKTFSNLPWFDDDGNATVESAE